MSFPLQTDRFTAGPDTAAERRSRTAESLLVSSALQAQAACSAAPVWAFLSAVCLVSPREELQGEPSGGPFCLHLLI